MKLHCLLIFVLFFSVPAGSLNPGSHSLQEWQNFAKSKEARLLLDWLKRKAAAKLSNTKYKAKLPVKTPPFFGRVGIFITLKKGKQVRGCFGAFDHTYTKIEDLLLDYLQGSLVRDYRKRPLELSELDSTEIIVTITSHNRPVSDIETIDLSQNGVFITCDSNPGIVIVPAEIRSISYLKRYIKSETCSVSVFHAVTIRSKQ